MITKQLKLAIITLFGFGTTIIAQVGPVNLERFTGQGVGGSLFAKMRNVKDIKSDLPTVGSVYIDDNFKPCKIYYNEEFVGDFYYRHNAFNDEIEIKDTPNAPEEEISSLMAMRQLTLIDNENGSKLALHVYSNKDENLRNGYLYLLKPGAKYSLYFKNNVKFTEGTHPVTSLTRPTPNKFSHFVEYYVKTTGEETAKYISKKTGDFLRVLEPENRAIAKDYVKNEKLNLKEEADITKLFDHLNNL
jgi:hypothetical protein